MDRKWDMLHSRENLNTCILVIKYEEPILENNIDEGYILKSFEEGWL